MKKVSIFLVLILVLALFAGCQTNPATTTTLPAAPETTVPAATETAPAETKAPVDPATVHPMLFHVTGENGQEAYLFGTIHVGDPRIDVALEALAPVVDGCDALAVEFDVNAFEKDLAAQMEAMVQFAYVDGTKVSDHMPKETFEKASALLQEAKLFPNLMENYNLAFWAQLVEQAAMITRCDYDFEGGMDRKLINHCYEKNIPVRDVESAKFQYDLLAGFPDELNLLLIENTLDHLDDYSESIDELYEAWVSGDYDAIVAVLNAENEEEEDDLTEEQTALLEDYNDKMLTQRNLGMRDKALEWLRAGDKVFFAVGAAHLVDEGGLVELLRAEGYTVEQVSFENGAYLTE